MSKKVRRFFYVRSVSGRRLHRLYKTRYNPVEGDRTACGIPVTPRWRNVSSATTVLRRCANCEKS